MGAIALRRGAQSSDRATKLSRFARVEPDGYPSGGRERAGRRFRGRPKWRVIPLTFVVSWARATGRPDGLL